MILGLQTVCNLKKITNLYLGIYYRDSDVFLADSVNLADSSDFFADISTFCHDGC